MTTYGHLASQCGVQLPNQVLRSNAGFYIGTLEDGMPFSRESDEYFSTQEDAEHALKTHTWIQKLNP